MNPAHIPDSLRTPVLSICVPTYNRAPYLECLLRDLADSISDLGYSYELLIGDNASHDTTSDVVAEFEDRLAIRYVQRSENVGVYHNLLQLIRDARGRYIVYVADDDLLMPGALGRHINYLESNPDVGAVFAPWLLHDWATKNDFDQFYSVEQQTVIPRGDHVSLFNFLVSGHVFPEIFIARAPLARAVAGTANSFAFYYFVHVAAMVDRSAIAFSPDSFYRQVIGYFGDASRAQEGNEEVKSHWDRYRGGLEYILARFASGLSSADLQWCQRAVDEFVRIRTHVGLRLRTVEGKNWIDNYYIANRLRCVGNDSLLAAPYQTYRINAAWEYLMALQPFYPDTATVGYYLDDPPRILPQAHDFSGDAFITKADRSVPFPDNVILLTSREPGLPGTAGFIISEDELMARFP